MLPTLPWPGSGLQTVPGTGAALPGVPAGGPEPDPVVFADAVARYLVLERLRGFRQSLYECLDARADALFELADAVLCADHAVTSLVQLSLEPEFTRGHGALYDALSAGQIVDFSGSGATLGFLATGTFGAATGTGTIRYTDGSSQSFTISVPDWYTTPPPAGSDAVISMPYRNAPNNVQDQHPVYVYYAGVPLTQGKTVKQVLLPSLSSGTAMHIFAMAIG